MHGFIEGVKSSAGNIKQSEVWTHVVRMGNIPSQNVYSVFT